MKNWNVKLSWLANFKGLKWKGKRKAFFLVLYSLWSFSSSSIYFIDLWDVHLFHILITIPWHQDDGLVAYFVLCIYKTTMPLSDGGWLDDTEYTPFVRVHKQVQQRSLSLLWFHVVLLFLCPAVHRLSLTLHITPLIHCV